LPLAFAARATGKSKRLEQQGVRGKLLSRSAGQQKQQKDNHCSDGNCGNDSDG